MYSQHGGGATQDSTSREERCRVYTFKISRGLPFLRQASFHHIGFEGNNIINIYIRYGNERNLEQDAESRGAFS